MLSGEAASVHGKVLEDALYTLTCREVPGSGSLGRHTWHMGMGFMMMGLELVSI